MKHRANRAGAVLALAALAAYGPVAAANALAGFDCLIEPNALVRVSTREEGILDAVLVDRGDIIKQGQILATLESGVERIAVELARARSQMRGTVESRRAAADYRQRQANNLG